MREVKSSRAKNSFFKANLKKHVYNDDEKVFEICDKNRTIGFMQHDIIL